MNPFRHFGAFRDHHHFGHHFGGHDRGDFAAHLIHRAARKLDLTDAQQTLLATLVTELQAQRAATKSGLPDLKGVLAGESFDRAAATQMLEARL